MLIWFGILIFIIYHFHWKRRGYPPGPMPLPIVGNFLQFDLANPHRTILRWRTIYGDVFTIWLPKPIVVLASNEVLVEALVKEREAFAARPSSFLYRLFLGSHHEGDGIILSSGERWYTQKKFAMEVLKGFGFGKNEMEVRIQFHIDRLLEQIDKLIDENRTSMLDPHHPLAFCIGNIIHDIVIGKRYAFGDAEFNHFKHLIDKVLQQVQSVQLLVADSYPWIAAFLPAFRSYYKNGMALQNFFLDEIDEHEAEMNKSDHQDGDSRDFIEAYLKEMKKRVDNPHFNKLTLALNAGDLWTGGMETTVTTIRWGIIYLIHFPKVQKKMRKEIFKVLGKSTRVDFSKRNMMPYCRAVIAELQRVANVLPWNIPHCTASDTRVGGYDLPKGTDVMPHIGAANHDPAYFPDPETFDPNRFIDGNGKFKDITTFTPFGLGLRQCLGMNLAQMELFLILITLVQRYRFTIPNGGDLPSLERRMGMASVPQEYICKWIHNDAYIKKD